MPQAPIFQVDAFADASFQGNPAAVCLLDGPWCDRTLQSIAAENNLSETAFVRAREDGSFDLRWFTPTTEVALCGHATLAAAWVLLVEQDGGEQVMFHTMSGTLGVQRSEAGLTMDFPATPPRPSKPPAGMLEVLGQPPTEFLHVRDAKNATYYLAVYDSRETIAALTPDTTTMGGALRANVITTAADTGVDFVSRFFAPASGIPEDPVTGSAHCALAPYWAEKLGKTTLVGHQISQRSGKVHCEVRGDRVALSGRCALYLKGQITW